MLNKINSALSFYVCFFVFIELVYKKKQGGGLTLVSLCSTNQELEFLVLD